jgi:DNA-binding transcriptional MocR family regulator
MSPERRAAVVGLCRRHGVKILEDDIFGWYLKAPPPSLMSMGPEITATLVSLSKTLAPGLRVSYLAFPEGLEDPLTNAIQTSAIMAPPLMAALAAAIIEDGTAKDLLAARRREAKARAALAAEILAPWRPRLPAEAIVAWLALPEPWRAVDFAAVARRRGVVVSPAEHFTPAREATEHAVRICLGPPRDRARLAEGLERLAGLLRHPPVTAAQTLL